MAVGLTAGGKNKLLKLVLNGVSWSTLADLGTATNLYGALHTASPAAGDQTTSETGYTGYGRITVPIDGTEWSIPAAVASNAKVQQWPTMTGGSSGSITHVSFGLASSGASEIIVLAALVTPKTLAVDEFIQFAIGACTFTVQDAA